jgi:hypothetical protein
VTNDYFKFTRKKLNFITADTFGTDPTFSYFLFGASLYVGGVIIFLFISCCKPSKKFDESKLEW